MLVLVLVVMKFHHKPPDRYCCKKNKIKMEQAKLARKLQHFRQGAVFCTPCCDAATFERVRVAALPATRAER